MKVHPSLTAFVVVAVSTVSCTVFCQSRHPAQRVLWDGLRGPWIKNRRRSHMNTAS